MAFFKSLAGPGYVILNIIRVLNITVLLSIAVACTAMLAKLSINNNFFVFDAATHIVVAIVALFLIVTELNIFRDYFNRYWPIFAQDSGLASLGTAMVILGMMTLGHLNNEAMEEESIGLPFWRLVLGAGIVAIVFGCVNVAVTYVFRDTQIGVTARHVRAHGAVAANKAMSAGDSHKSFQLSRKDSLPSYRSSSTSSPRSASTRSGARFPVKITSPLNEHTEHFSKPSPTPNLAVPNLAHHPAMYSDRV